jgi:hypothetical protein
LSADDVLKEMDNVDKINFCDYRDERWDHVYYIDVLPGVNFRFLLIELSGALIQQD